MVQEEYVNFETAKLLKDKGFNAFCRAGYNTETGEFNIFDYIIDNIEIYENWIAAPTQQMAMKWLREENDLFISILVESHTKKINATIHTTTDGEWDGFWFTDGFDRNKYDTYEEAAEAAIQYCLKELF